MNGGRRFGTTRPDRALAVVIFGACLATVASAQAFPYLVQIHGTPKPGSGFVVGLRQGVATVVTASHVIMGAQRFEVTFAVAAGQRFPVDSAVDVVGMQTDETHGLATFRVRGVIPATVSSLSLDTETTLDFGDDKLLEFVGFPNQARSPRRLTGNYAGRDGLLVIVDRSVGRGASGGPLIRDGKAVGLVTSTDAQLTYAVNALVVRETLRGWDVRLGGSIQAISPPPPAPVEVCQPGKEESEDNGIVFVRICAGEFMMGSADDDPQAGDDEKPAHKVTLSEYWIGKYEVTNEQFRRFRPEHSGEAKLPAVSVSWTEAKEFCESLGLGLPTEAQWEYSARAGTQTRWSFGDDESVLGDYAWYGEGFAGGVHPVGEKKPNGWGLHDMHGNVLEWIADWYGPYTAGPKTDPEGSPKPATSAFRVLRGGSFVSGPGRLRSACRGGYRPEVRSRLVGFRCVRIPRRQP